MNIDENNIQYWLQQSAKIGKSKINEFDWIEMQRLLTEKKKRRFLFWWIALLLLIIGSATTYLFFTYINNNSSAAENVYSNSSKEKSRGITKDSIGLISKTFNKKTATFIFKNTLNKKLNREVNDNKKIETFKSKHKNNRDSVLAIDSKKNKQYIPKNLADIERVQIETFSKLSSNQFDFLSISQPSNAITFFDVDLQKQNSILHTLHATEPIPLQLKALNTPDSIFNSSNFLDLKRNKHKKFTTYLEGAVGAGKYPFNNSFKLSLFISKKVSPSLQVGLGAGITYSFGNQQFTHQQFKGSTIIPGTTNRLLQYTNTNFTTPNEYAFHAAVSIQKQWHNYLFAAQLKYQYVFSSNINDAVVKDSFRIINSTQPTIQPNNAFNHQLFNGRQFGAAQFQVGYRINEIWQIATGYTIPIFQQNVPQVNTASNNQIQIILRKKINK